MSFHVALALVAVFCTAVGVWAASLLWNGPALTDNKHARALWLALIIVLILPLLMLNLRP